MYIKKMRGWDLARGPKKRGQIAYNETGKVDKGQFVPGYP